MHFQFYFLFQHIFAKNIQIVIFNPQKLDKPETSEAELNPALDINKYLDETGSEDETISTESSSSNNDSETNNKGYINSNTVQTIK